MEGTFALSQVYQNDHITIALLLSLLLFAHATKAGAVGALFSYEHFIRIPFPHNPFVTKQIQKGLFLLYLFLQIIISFGLWILLFAGYGHGKIVHWSSPLLLWGGGVCAGLFILLWISIQQLLAKYLKLQEEIIEWLANYILMFERFGIVLWIILIPAIYIEGAFLYSLGLSLLILGGIKMNMLYKMIHLLPKTFENFIYFVLYILTFEVIPLLAIYKWFES